MADHFAQELQQELGEFLGQLFVLRFSVAPVCPGQQITIRFGLLDSPHSALPSALHAHTMPGIEGESVFRVWLRLRMHIARRSDLLACLFPAHVCTQLRGQLLQGRDPSHVDPFTCSQHRVGTAYTLPAHTANRQVSG